MNTQHHYLYEKSSTPPFILEDYLQADNSFDLQQTEQPITQNPCVTKELDDELLRDKEMEEKRERERESIMLCGHNVTSLHVQLYGHPVNPPQCKDVTLVPAKIREFAEIRWTSLSTDSIETILPHTHTHTQIRSSCKPSSMQRYVTLVAAKIREFAEI